MVSLLHRFAYALKATSFRNFNFPLTLPYNALWALTFKCNSRCKHCSIWKIYRKKENLKLLKEEFTVDEFKKVVNSNKEFTDLWLTGGEPFLKEGIEEIYSFLAKKKIYFVSNTNAVLPNLKDKLENIFSMLPKKTHFSIDVSIDGFEKQHDFIRGIKGLWKRAINLLKYLKSKEEEFENFKTAVNITLMKFNIDIVKDYFKFMIEKIGLHPCQVNFAIVGESDTYYHKGKNYSLAPSKEKIIEVVEWIKKNYKCHDNYYTNGLIRYVKKPFKMKCYAAHSFCYIDPYLNVYPCIYMNEKIGNLRDYNYDFKKLWRSEKAKELREKVKKWQCPECTWTSCVVSPNVNSNPILGFKKALHKI